MELAMGLTRAVLLVFALAAAGCSETHEYRYPSPDWKATVVVSPAGGVAVGRRNRVYLEGAETPTQDDGRVRYDRADLGAFDGPWTPAAIAWIDGKTVNVCPLDGVDGVPASVSLLVGEDARGRYRITTDCRAVPRAPPPTSARSGSGS